MQVILLYSAAVLIWGTTWIAISFQLHDVAPSVSLVYRFGLASMLLFIICKVAGYQLKFSANEHLRLLGIGLTMFGFNFYLLYQGQQHLNSALAAITFATLVVMNMLNARWIYKTAITFKDWLGAIFGLVGICTLFWPQIAGVDVDMQTLGALALCLCGTFIASMSNMLSISNQKKQMAVLPSNAWAMGYGALTMASIALFNGDQFVVDLPLNYWLATGYLSLFGSVIVFACYLSLLSKIGAYKTSYVAVLTPAIAVVISSIYEDFSFTSYTISGLLLILFGNVICLSKLDKWFKRSKSPALSQQAEAL